MRELTFGQKVMTSDSKHIGSVQRLIVANSTSEGSSISTFVVTGLTVQSSLMVSGNLFKPGGLDKSRDRIVSIVHVNSTDSGIITLDMTENEFVVLPQYIVEEVVDVNEDNLSPRFIAEDVAFRTSTLLAGSLYDRHTIDVENRQAGEHHVSHDTTIWRVEPHSQLGNLDRVLVQEQSQYIHALVVRRGFIFKHEVLLSGDSITDILDDLVHINISDSQLETLAPYPN